MGDSIKNNQYNNNNNDPSTHDNSQWFKSAFGFLNSALGLANKRIVEDHQKTVEADQLAEIETKKNEEAEKLANKLKKEAEQKKTRETEEASKTADAKAREE